MPGDRPEAWRRALELCEPARRAAAADGREYLDLLGEADPIGSGWSQRLMKSRVLPEIYQRYWRRLGARLLMGLGGPGTAEEHRMALEMLAIATGDRVLDVACGPGNFTRDFARASAPDGLVVGVDASPSMLEVAARENAAGNIAYIRADAGDLPFRDGSFDAVCCFAALYLIERPMRTVEELVRVLAPGGRLALLASCARGPRSMRAIDEVIRRTSGVRVFGRDELTRALREGGVADVSQRVFGMAQFVSAGKPLR